MYAKTLYKPEFPPEVAEKVAHFTKKKLPAFFEFAKDKTPTQVCGRNSSFVNKIYNKIKKKPLVFKRLGLDFLNYRVMMNNPNIDIDPAVINKYKKLNRTYQYVISNSTVEDSGSYVFNMIKKEFEQLDYSWAEMSDMLIKDLYSKKAASKQMYWQIFGDEAVKVLKQKLKLPIVSYRQCTNCGEFFEIQYGKRKNPTLCSNCRCQN